MYADDTTAAEEEPVTLAVATTPETADLTGPGEDFDDYTAALDIEAQLLCSLIWARPDVAARATSVLTSNDFYRPVHIELYVTIAELVAAGKPHDGPYVLLTLQQAGRTSGHLGKQLTKTLTDIMTIGIPSGELEHYIDAVLAQAYRRGFRDAARALTEAAETLPEADLYEHMCTLGRQQRAATERLAAIRAGRP